MMCGCGQESTTTHACFLVALPLCWCGQPAIQTHGHLSMTAPLSILLPWMWLTPTVITQPTGDGGRETR